MRPLEYAVVGLGNMGRHHVRVAADLPEFHLAALCDIDEERGRATADRFGCPYFSDFREMFASSPLEAVSVAVPTHLHEEVTREAIRHGLHVLVEKPLSGDLASARRLVSLANSAGIKLMVGHVERFNPAVERLKGLLEERRFGKVISLTIRRVGGLPPSTRGANVLLDLAVHDVDVAGYLLGTLPTRKLCFMSRGLLKEVEDNAILFLKYGEVSVFIEVNWITPVKIRTLDITGTACFGQLDYINQEITLFENAYFRRLHQDQKAANGTFSDYQEFVARSNLTDRIEVGINRDEPLKRELRAFARCIREDLDPPVSGNEALRTLEILLDDDIKGAEKTPREVSDIVHSHR